MNSSMYPTTTTTTTTTLLPNCFTYVMTTQLFILVFGYFLHASHTQKYVHVANTRDTQVAKNIEIAQLHHIYTEDYVVNC